MKYRWSGARVLLGSILSLVCIVSAPALHAADGRKSAAGWKVPRTPDGKPDLQGNWTNATLTQLERSLEHGDRKVLTAEEARKIEASSIGPVVAGLTELRAFLAEASLSESDRAIIDEPLLNELIDRGWEALREILPAECIQPDPKLARRYDAALLFLISPLGLLDDEMAMEIVNQTVEHLAGPIGIRRYLGDSYWCANYRDLLSPEVRTSDFSDDMSARDSLLKPGEEAQWCIFDPIISVIYGERYLKTRSVSDLEQQVHHLRRSLGQLTGENPRFPRYRCPESYFLEHGNWVPNDITPLLWTQANLLLALHQMKKTADVSARS